MNTGGGGRSRGTWLLVVLLSGVGLVAPAPASVGAERAAQPAATVLDVPLGARLQPRRVEVLPGGDGPAVVHYADADDNAGRLRLLEEDGTWGADLPPDVAYVSAGRAVVLGPHPDNLVLSFPVAGGERIALTEKGEQLVDATTDGVLTIDLDRRGLTVAPLDGSPRRAVTGLPDVVDGLGPHQSVVAGRLGRPGGFVDVYTDDPVTMTTYFVDTATARAWPLPVGGSVAVSKTTIAWLERAEDRSVTVVTVDRPTEAQPRPTPVERLTGYVPPPSGVELELAGEHPLLVTGAYDPDRLVWRWSTDVVTPGGLRPLLAGRGVGTHDGRYRAVVQSETAEDGGAVVEVDPATSVTTTLVPFGPVAATAHEVALGNGRLYVGDDGTGPRPASYLLQPEGLGSRLASNGPSAQGPFSAGGGTLVVGQGETTGVREPDGTPRSEVVDGDRRLLASHGSLGLGNRYGSVTVVDLVDGRSVVPAYLQPHDIADGVVVGLLQERLGSAPRPPAVTLADARTGRSETVGIPASCQTVQAVQAVHASLGVDCDTSFVVLDRTGTRPTVTIDTAGTPRAELVLGDGFVLAVVDEPDDPYRESRALRWRPLEPADAAWQDLGRVSWSYWSPRRHDRIAVSRDDTSPSVAWLTPEGGVRLAHLPVAPLPRTTARPEGPATAPGAVAPVLASAQGSRRIDVSWPARPADEQVSDHVVRLFYAAQPTTVLRTVTVAGAATGTSFGGLEDWADYQVEVTTRNGVGSATGRSSVLRVLPTDDTPPEYVELTVPAVTLGDTVRLRTSAYSSGPGAAVESVDLRRRELSGSRRGRGWTYPSALTALKTYGPLDVPVTGLARGSTHCFSMRARDSFGQASPWTAEQCTAVAFDDRDLVRSAAFTPESSTSYLLGSASRTTAVGARASRGGLRASRAWLVATTCPSCGSVGVYDDGALLATLDLRSATTTHQQVIEVPFRGTRRTGTLSVRVISSGKPVVVDGLALRAW